MKKRNVKKIKILLYTDDDKPDYIDFYLDMDSIRGMYIPHKEIGVKPCVNIVLNNGVYSVLLESTIQKYLEDNFILV